jgi:chloride channel protein, CIC family
LRTGKSIPFSGELWYLRKWLPIGILIGVVSGLGALVFDSAIGFFSSLLARAYSVPVLEKLFVKDAMTTHVITVNPDTLVLEAAEVLKKNGIRGLPVTDNKGGLVCIITLIDILQIHPDQRSKKVVGTVMTKEVVVTYPNESLSSVLEKLTGNQIGRLLVVNPSDKKCVMGIITRQDIWRVYRIEINSRLDEEHKLSGSVEKT